MHEKTPRHRKGYPDNQKTILTCYTTLDMKDGIYGYCFLDVRCSVTL